MNELKYKIRKDLSKVDGGITIYRIEALKDFSDVKKGDLGGWIEKEDNLSQIGDCWVYDNACLFNNVVVKDNAQIHGNARIYDDVYIFDNARIYDNVFVEHNARIFGNATIRHDAYIWGNAKIYGDATIYNSAKVYYNAVVHGNAVIKDKVKVFGNAEIYGNAKVYDECIIYGEAVIRDYAFLYGNAEIGGNAIIKHKFEYIVCRNNWSSGRFFTYTHSNKMWKVGCFYGTGKELIKKAYEDSELSGKNYEATVKYVEELYSNIETALKEKKIIKYKN